MTGDRLPVAISDMDLHIFRYRSLLYAQFIDQKTNILSLKETIAVLQTHTSSLAKRVARCSRGILYDKQCCCFQNRMKKEARNHLQEKQREMVCLNIQEAGLIDSLGAGIVMFAARSWGTA